jgi:hypothetical protein
VYEDVAIQFYGPVRGRKLARVADRTFATRAPRAPSGWPRASAHCGTVLALEVMGPRGTLYEHRWSAGAPPMFWLERSSSVLIAPGARPGPKTEIVPGENAAKRASARWNRRFGLPGARSRRLWKLPSARALRQQGAALRIVYRDPVGALWQHPFETGVRVWLGRGTPPSVIVVRGGRLRMTSRGLEG